jgi:hypothetical protein
MNKGCLKYRCPYKYLLPILEGCLLITQNVHINANISWGKIVLCAIVGKLTVQLHNFREVLLLQGRGMRKLYDGYSVVSKEMSY